MKFNKIKEKDKIICIDFEVDLKLKVKNVFKIEINSFFDNEIIKS